MDYKTDSEFLGRNFRLLRIEWDSKYENNLSQLNFNVDYRRPSDDTTRSAKFNWSSDCYTGSCNTYKMNYDTNSDILGSKVKLFNFDFNKSVTDNDVTLDINAKYRRPEDKSNKNASLKVSSVCSNGRNCLVSEVNLTTDTLSVKF